MSATGTIAVGRNVQAFFVKESTMGQIAIPAAGNMIVVNTAELKIPNNNYEEDKGLRSSRSFFSRIQTTIPAGTFKLSHYIKPSGALGTSPEASDLLECVTGLKTVNAGVDVRYTPTLYKPCGTLYVKQDHTVYVATGCAVDKFSTKKDNKGVLEGSEDGKFMSGIWTGTGALAEVISTTPAVGTEEWFSVDDVKKWCTGSHILIGTEQIQITGTFWEGTSGGTAGKIKMKRGHNSSTVATHPNGTAITPWLPTGTETGTPLAARIGVLSVDAATVPFLDLDYNYDDSVTMNEDEVTGIITPTDYYEGDRKVTGKVTIYYRKADNKWFVDARTQTRKALILNYGSVAGKRVAISMPYCELDIPEIASDKQAQKLSIGYQAFASTGNDEATLIFS
jgi:hypothetical protein